MIRFVEKVINNSFKKISLNKLISNLIASNGNEANDGTNEWQQFKRMA